MTNTFPTKNSKELTSALKNLAYAPYHRRLQAIPLSPEGLSFKNVGGFDRLNTSDRQKSSGFKNKASRTLQDVSDKLQIISR